MRKKYTHVSFDAWMTLIKPNPYYAEARNLLLKSTVFPDIDVSQVEFEYMVKHAKRFVDFSNEITGDNMPIKQAILLTAFQVYDRMPKEKILLRIENFLKKLEKINKEYCPLWYSDETKDVLSKIKSLGISMNLSCNTSFIEGRQLYENKFCTLPPYIMDFYLFSDEVGFSKPHPVFFYEILIRSEKKADEILHVGDNSYSDGGCQKIGIDFFQVHGDTGKTIEDVLKFLSHD